MPGKSVDLWFLMTRLRDKMEGSIHLTLTQTFHASIRNQERALSKLDHLEGSEKHRGPRLSCDML